MTLTAKTTTYSLELDDVRKLIASALNVEESKVEVKYIIEEVNDDPEDRFRGTDTVTRIDVTVRS